MARLTLVLPLSCRVASLVQWGKDTPHTLALGDGLWVWNVTHGSMSAYAAPFFPSSQELHLPGLSPGLSNPPFSQHVITTWRAFLFSWINRDGTWLPTLLWGRETGICLHR